jgi:hypothetical protein
MTEQDNGVDSTFNSGQCFNSFSMSYEIDCDALVSGPCETNGFSIGFGESERPGFFETVRDDTNGISRFYDPTPERPMDAAIFISHLNLNSVVRELRSYYKDLDHFHHPIEAMVRTIIYQRLAGLRHTTQLESRLCNSPNNTIARNLGFIENRSGVLKTPDRSTIEHFTRTRLGSKGTGIILDAMVVELKKRLERRGVRLGRSIAIDSTPLESMYGDEDAGYNGHYEMQMFKIHNVVCVETGLSIAKIVSRANAYDGDYLIPLIRKLQSLGICVEEVIGDQHYGTLSNYAKLNLEFGIKTKFNLAKRDRWRKDGEPQSMINLYNSMWREPDFVPNADLDQILRFLLSRGHTAPVGAYFRNEWLEFRRRHSKQWHQMYDKRTIVERFHAHIKEQLGLERNLKVRGQEAVEIYTNLFWIAEIACALTRVQNGVKTNLLRANQRELF